MKASHLWTIGFITSLAVTVIGYKQTRSDWFIFLGAWTTFGTIVGAIEAHSAERWQKREKNEVSQSHAKQDAIEEKMWDLLAENRCPDCFNRKTLGVVATGGLSLNIRCFNCNSLFWATPERAFGAKRLNNSAQEKDTESCP